MKTDFKFSSLLGSVYCQGNVLFSPDGQVLYSPVSNRVTAFDLVNNRSWTFPFAHRKNVSRIGLSPRGNLLLTVDEDGQAILTSVQRRVSVYHFSLGGGVTALAFSPSGRHFAVGIGRRIEVWHVPATPDASSTGELEFAPFVRHHSHMGHYDDVTHIEWSGDSRFFLSASKDQTARVWSLNPEEGFKPTVLSGHKQAVVGAWFSENQEVIYTTSRDGAVFEWRYAGPPRQNGDANDDDDGDDDEKVVDESEFRWRIIRRHYFMQGSSTVRCGVYHAESSLLVVGFSDGVFGLYELSSGEMNQIHKLSVSSDIDTVSINRSGEWVAFASSKARSLLVWEWQSESYVLKQASHFDAINALVYAPDGRRIVTTADDGKIKIWDAESGFTIATFTEHQSGVTACEFAKKGNVLFTASLDGSVRAWDLVRYRCFRTFTAPSRLSFTSLAVDPSGEVVCAGSVDSFDIHVWSVQTGQLLDRLSGHEGPVSALAFAPDGSTLASGSWDKTARLWSIFSRTATSEPLQLQADVLDVAIRPDSRQLAVSTLDGQLSFWDMHEAEQVAGLDGRRDVSGGRRASDRRTASNVSGNKAFGTIEYSRDGSCLLAGGRSKYICLYSVHTMVLLKKWTVSVNLSLSGTQEFLNSKLLTEAGPTSLLDDQGDLSDPEARKDLSLPGSKRGGDPSTRRKHAEVRVSGVAFSPAGTSFCAASTEGLLVYTVGSGVQFDPFDLAVEVTPASTLAALEQDGDFVRALAMAFRLNDQGLVRRVFQAVPHADIPLVAAQVPAVYLARLLRFVAAQTEESPHVEFCLLWIRAIVDAHGSWLAANRAKLDVELRLVSRAVARMRDDIRRLADDNVYMVGYLVEQAGKTTGNKTGVSAAAAALDVLMPVAADVDMLDEGGVSDASDGEWMGFE